MAIQCKITTIQGVTLESAYINLATPQISKTKTETGNVYKASANACIYVSQDYYDTCVSSSVTPVPLEGFSVVCELDLDGNVLEQLYAELSKNERLTEVVELL